MMKTCDAVVIGGGVLGCFAARNLRRWNISTVLIEAREDICTGISRANSAIIYSGCDHRYGSLKAAMSVRINAAFEQLSDELQKEVYASTLRYGRMNWINYKNNTEK